MLTGEKKKEYQKRWWAEHKGIASVYMQKYLSKPGNRKKSQDRRDDWAKRNPNKVIEKRVSKYGLTFVKYNEMLLSQNNSCKICLNVFAEQPCVDHDHSTGKVRGLLCKKCNIGLGAFKDKVVNLENAIRYLMESRDA